MVPFAAQFNDVERCDGGCYRHRLTNFQPVDSGIDVDGIGTEYSQHSHVHIVN